MSSQADRWLGAEVRVHAGFDLARQRPPLASGIVLGYAQHPTILVRNELGGQSNWQTSLPIDVVTPPAGPEGALRVIPYRADPAAQHELTNMLGALTEISPLVRRRTAELLGWDGSGEVPDAAWITRRLDAYMDGR